MSNFSVIMHGVEEREFRRQRLPIAMGVKDDGYVFRVDVPGASKEDLTVDVGSPGNIVYDGEVRGTGRRYLTVEQSNRTVLPEGYDVPVNGFRSIVAPPEVVNYEGFHILPQDADYRNAESVLTDGMLDVYIPRREPERVSIAVSDGEPEKKSEEEPAATSA